MLSGQFPVGPPELSGHCRGRGSIPLRSILEKLANALDVSVGELLK